MIQKLSMLVVAAVITRLLLGIHESRASLAKPGCVETCGNISIPYPFGVGTGCYLDKSFEVLCNISSQDHLPVRFANNTNFPILEFSTDMVRVIQESTAVCKSHTNISQPAEHMGLDQYFYFSQDHNVFVAIGCEIAGLFMNPYTKKEQFGCESACDETLAPPITSTNSCTGHTGCCQASISDNVTSYISVVNFSEYSGTCAIAFVAEKNAPIVFGVFQLQYPVTLSWVVALTTCDRASGTGNYLCGRNSDCVNSKNGLGYNCRCRQGYKGNPYLPDGCQGGNETCVYPHGSYKCISPPHHKSNVSLILETGIGLLAFGVVCFYTYLKLARIVKAKNKRKFFENNGGHLLKQQIYANKTSGGVIIKVYTTEEMEKATRNFSRNMILGKGGQGTVYKGLFPDGTVIAIKKSNVVDANQIARFVNEVFILAQINHRNIVKLLGCCLEYKVPLLVYEYFANDTLSEHLYDGAERPKLLWKDSMRVAREVAGALAYLHSYASPVIFHRDIKPNNILLDQNYKAVVSDFGLSRAVPLSKSHLTTQVEGTFGYLDPEYFETGQLTAKSDVYSFGVVLIELLTKKRSTSSSDSGEGLVPRFKYLMQHSRVIEILDKEVAKEALMDDVLLVANLAKRCMKMNSKKRPSMEEVIVDLDKLRVA